MPGIIVPADFGIENLQCKIHSNITIKLQGFSDIRASSLILSFNSPVFSEIFSKYEADILDLKEYTPSIVRLFIESLYKGTVVLDKHQFREFSKLSSQYKVAWLILKCHDFFSTTLKSVTKLDTDDILMLFEEACSVKLSCGDPFYLHLVLQRITQVELQPSYFIARYMNRGYVYLSRAQVDLMLAIKSVDVENYLNIVLEQVTRNQSFDGTSRIILLEVDLVKAMERDSELYLKLINFLLRELKNIADTDKKMISRLHDETMKEHQNRHPELKKSGDNSLGARALNTLRRMGSKTELKLGPSKRQLFQCYTLMDNLSLDELIVILALSSEVRNLFMMLESLDMFGCWANFTDKSLSTIIARFEDQGWTKIPPSFLNSLYWLTECPEKKDMLSSNTELFSPHNHTIITSNRITTPKRFLLEEQYHRFIFPRPCTLSCEVLTTMCGVLAKTSPLTDHSKFTISLLEDHPTYTEHHLHFHRDIVKRDRIHFVLEMFNNIREDGVNMEVSWCRGLPEVEKEGIQWGGWTWSDLHKARLIMYFDNS